MEFMVNDCEFTPCLTTPCMFFRKDKGLRVVIHGYDFTVFCPHSSLMWFREVTKTKFMIKFRVMVGPSKNDDSSVRILNRTVAWDKFGIRYQADPRHVEIIIDQFGGSKSL